MRVIQIVEEKTIYTINTDKIISIVLDKENNNIEIQIDHGLYKISYKDKSFPVELFATVEEESIKDKFTIEELYNTIVDFICATVNEINKMVIDNS
jgi:hypothetical protein